MTTPSIREPMDVVSDEMMYTIMLEMKVFRMMRLPSSAMEKTERPRK